MAEIIDYDDGRQIGKPIGERKNLVDVFLIFSDEERGAAVAHLVFDFGPREPSDKCRRAIRN